MTPSVHEHAWRSATTPRLRLVLRLTGVLVQPDEQQVTASQAAWLVVGLPMPLLAGGVASIVAGDGIPWGLAGAALLVLAGAVLFAGSSRLTATGLEPRRARWRRRPVQLTWDQLTRLSIRPVQRVEAMIVPVRPTGAPAAPFVAGSNGLFRSTRPLRIVAAAAVIGALPESTPVFIRREPRLPSSRAALRLLQAHHPRVVVGSDRTDF